MSLLEDNPFLPPERPNPDISGFLFRDRQNEIHRARGIPLPEDLNDAAKSQVMTGILRVMAAARRYVPVFSELIDEAEQHTGSPLEVLVLSHICASAAAGMGAYDVIDHRENRSSIGIFGFGFAITGAGKSPGVDRAFKPLHQFELDLEGEIADAKKRYKALFSAWNAKRKGLEKLITSMEQRGNDTTEACARLVAHEEMEPCSPSASRFLFSRVTSSQLQDAMALRPSVAISTAESESFFHGYGARDLSLLNECWDGAPSGGTDRPKIARPRLSICAWGQPSVLNRFMVSKGEKAKDLGAFPRMLLSVVPSAGRRVHLNPGSSHCTDAYNQTITRLLRESQVVMDGGKPRDLWLSPDAKSLLNESVKLIWKLEEPGRRFNGAQEYVAKLPSHILRIAGAIHLLVRPGDPGEISENELRFSLHYASYCADEYVRIFSKSNSASVLADDLKRTLDHFILRGTVRICRSDILRNGLGGVRSQAALNLAMQALDPDYRRCYRGNERKGYFDFSGN